MPSPELLLVLHCLAAFALAGLIWFVQLVHYPLLHKAGMEDTYYIENALRTGRIVVPLMVLELATGMLLLLPGMRPEFLPLWVVALGMLLVALAWIVTFGGQASRHRILIQCRYNGKIVNEIIRLNWIRTAAWSLRAVLLAAFLVGGLAVG